MTTVYVLVPCEHPAKRRLAHVAHRLGVDDRASVKPDRAAHFAAHDPERARAPGGVKLVDQVDDGRVREVAGHHRGAANHARLLGLLEQRRDAAEHVLDPHRLHHNLGGTKRDTARLRVRVGRVRHEHHGQPRERILSTHRLHQRGAIAVAKRDLGEHKRDRVLVERREGVPPDTAVTR